MSSLLERQTEVRPGEAAVEFLEQARDVAQGTLSFTVAYFGPHMSPPYDRALDLVASDSSAYAGFKVRLLSRMEPRPRVEVYLFPPTSNLEITYEAYRSSARGLMQPLLRAVNQLHGTKLRLYISGEKRPRMLQGGVKSIFDQYGKLANKDYAHPLDWELFYRLIIHCHDFHVNLGGSDLAEHLRGLGFSEPTVSELVSVYKHGRAVLGMQRQARSDRARERFLRRQAGRNV